MKLDLIGIDPPTILLCAHLSTQSRMLYIPSAPYCPSSRASYNTHHVIAQCRTRRTRSKMHRCQRSPRQRLRRSQSIFSSRFHVRTPNGRCARETVVRRRKENKLYSDDDNEEIESRARLSSLIALAYSRYKARVFFTIDCTCRKFESLFLH